MGPTASGKTDAAMHLADHFSVALVSVDSAMVYRGMDIGSAKPDKATLEKYPHALVDIREPWEVYSAADFAHDAKLAMQQSLDDGHVPLLAGGTMLYFRALNQGLSDMPSADSDTRRKLMAELESSGQEAMHARLASLDPDAARRIHPNDPQRLLRALEVYELTGKPISHWQSSATQGLAGWDILKIALVPEPRALLHERIEKRIAIMLEQGLVDEVRALLSEAQINADLPAMKSVGYRQVMHYLQGEYSAGEMRDRILYATRQLAKRQMTWLRKEDNLHWLDPLVNGANDTICDLVCEFLKKKS